MPRIEKKEVFPYPAEKIYQVIVDFASYPEFVSGVDEIEILKSSETHTTAQYSLNLIKKFSYVLELEHEKPHRVSWDLKSGDFFKKNSGGWDLKPLSENETEVTYYLDVEFKMFAPKMVVNKLVANNLPQMLKAFQKRIAEVG